LMLSNHYSFTYTSPYAWIIMSLFLFAGSVIRQYLVLRHAGRNQLVYPLAGVVLLLAAFWLASPPSTPVAQGAAPPSAEGVDGLAQVQAIVQSRCVACHAATPRQAGFAAPPAGIVLESQAQTLLHAALVKQVVASGYMPLGNITHMTEAERAVIAAWTGMQP